MKLTALCLPALLLAATGVHAQQSTPGCPQLPADSGLAWEHRATGTSDFCRALREDGSEAFGLYIADESPFEPHRKNREETGHVGGFEVQWYRAEIATHPDIAARETLIKLPDGRMAHLWLQAPTGEQLQRAFELTRDLRFGADRQMAGSAPAP